MPHDREGQSRRHFLQISMAAVGAGAGVAATAQPASPADAAPPANEMPAPPYCSALDAARAIRGKQISSVELTKLSLERIAKHNPAINAIVQQFPDEAMKRAQEADAAIARGEWWGPFHGVPVTVKDCFDQTGAKCTGGAPELANNVPTSDAPIVARLRRTGGVIVGRTNVPLFSADMQTYNAVYGTTNNPWDPTRSPGGSTGGGAASLAAGFDYFTIGSDIGGSIRNPAHFCGVYGHKPTLDVVPNEQEIASIPDGKPWPRDLLSVAGMLARSASDIHTGMVALGGPVGDIARGYRWTMPPARRTRLSEYRMRYVLDHPACPVLPEVRAKLEESIEALRKAGVQLEEGWPDGIDPLAQYQTYAYMLMCVYAREDLTEEQSAQMRSAAKGDPGNPLVLRAKAWTDFHPGYKDALRTRMAHQQAWQAYFQTHDAFLMPTAFTTAFPHLQTEPIELRMIDTGQGKRLYIDLLFWISFATMTGCPATIAPLGTTSAGLPCGLQIMGPYMEDATPIDIAGKLADSIGGFTPPPNLLA